MKSWNNQAQLKVIVLALCLFISSFFAYAQNMSAPKSFFIAKEIKPPVLDIDHYSIVLDDPSGNNAIDANETCVIKFDVKNVGLGDGMGCVAKVSAQGTTDDIIFGDVQVNTIPAGATIQVAVPVISGMETKDGSITFALQVTEVQGFGTEPTELTVNTRKFVSPMVQIVDYTITGSSASAKLEKRIPFDLQLLLQNTEYGKAEDVTVEVSVPDGVMLLDEGMVRQSFSTLQAGEMKSLVYPLIAMVSYNKPSIPINVTVREKYGKYSENKTVTLNLNQNMSSTKVVVDEIGTQKADIKIGQLASAVDKNVPSSNVINDKTFAVIIANENYQNAANVPYAINDGGVFRNYCERTLGIPTKNIHYITNATLNNIQGEVSWLENVMRSYEGQAKAIVYYAGHGIPDVASNDAYLLPVDGIGTNVRTGYKLESLYATLGSLPGKSITVFLDACFSGANRDGEMVNPNQRGVVIRANTAAPNGNMVVFSAAQGNETAIPFTDESHGMFTYFLLKKLQETAGDVTFEELSDYIQRNVRQRSSVLGKTQTPSVIPSVTLGDAWKSWRLK
jgi:hypothetical protein